MPDISCWHQCSCRTGKCWHASWCCCFSLQLLNVGTHWNCQDQEVHLLFFPPSFRWVLSDLLVASLFSFSGITSPASWKAAVAMFLWSSSQPSPALRKLSQRWWRVLLRLVQASCTNMSRLVGRRGSSRRAQGLLAAVTQEEPHAEPRKHSSCTESSPPAEQVSAGTSHPLWREVPRAASCWHRLFSFC